MVLGLEEVLRLQKGIKQVLLRVFLVLMVSPSFGTMLSCTSHNIPDQSTTASVIEGAEDTSNLQGPTDFSPKLIRDKQVANAKGILFDPSLNPLRFRERVTILNKPLITLQPNLQKGASNKNPAVPSVEITLNTRVAKHLADFYLNKRGLIIKWLERSGRYLPVMKKILRQYGLPEELVYLAMIESGLDNHALSPAMACGPWQLIKGTGLRYGLRIDYWVDERRDPLKSTEAAAKYLRDLYRMFGCWSLTIAGYNAGEGTILSAIKKANTRDFWTLAKKNYLPAQTREFVPKFMAAAIIAQEYEDFGFKDLIFLPPLKFDYVKVRGGTPLKLIAKYSKVSYQKIKRLNPELRKGITPPNMNTYKLKIPYGYKETFLKKWNKGKKVLASLPESDENFHYYRIKKGDTLWEVTRRFKVSLKKVRQINNIKDPTRIQPNQIILIPKRRET
jgi:membrane-bound lytic murein transglycosylase D